MRAGDVPKFKMQGVDQCWHCKHRDGSGVHHVNGYWYRLPYCKVCDADMTIIYEPPCREFEAEEGECGIAMLNYEEAKPKPITNADRIRAMSDEDLAKYLAWLEDEQACYQWEMYGDAVRITDWLDWLKQEVETNDS